MSSLQNAMYQELLPDTLHYFYNLTDSYIEENTYKLVTNQYPFLDLQDVQADHSMIQDLKYGKDNESNTQVSNVKKLYVLRGCSYTRKRIKELASFNNIKIVNDIHKADTVLVPKTVRFKTKELTSKTLYYDNFVKYDGGKHITSDSNWFYNNRMGNRFTISVSYSKQLVSYLYLNVQALIAQKKISVLVENDLHSNSKHLVAATKDVIDDICSQFHDKDTRQFAADLAVNLDFTGAEYLKFYFIKKIKYDLWNTGRLFDFNKFLEDNGINRFKDMTAMSVIVYLHNKNLLCKEGFKYLEEIARKGIYIQKGDIYKFNVSFKDEYKKYLK